MNVTVNGYNITGGSLTATSWSGAPFDTGGSEVMSLQRTGSLDTNSAADWRTASPTQGTLNQGLSIPFSYSATSGVGYIATAHDFQVTRYHIIDGYHQASPQAEAVIADPSSTKYSEIVPTVNYYNTGNGGHFDDDRTFPGAAIGANADEFAVLATGKVIIPAAGLWTFGVTSDDGFKLDLTGPGGSFTSSYDAPRGLGDTLATFNIPTPGTYDVRLVMFEEYDGSTLEFYAAPGNHPVYTDEFRLVGDAAGGGLAMTGFGDAVKTDIRSPMQGVNTSVWTRYAFTAADVAQYVALTLHIKYNDGFVAFLNGTEIARRNAPSALAWNSQALGVQPSPYSWVEEEINLTTYLHLLQAGNNVLAIQGLNAAAGTADFLLLPELIGVRQDANPLVRYLGEPTPNEPNTGTPYVDFVADAQFSTTHGFFTSSFPLQITTATPGASIYYTLDGTDPSPTNGTLYAGPLTIGQTSVVRAAAFKTDFHPTAIATETYIFTADVIQQSPAGQAPAGWPTGPINGQLFDYGMDPNIVNVTPWSSQIENALKAIPTISLVTDLDNLFDPATGIYVNADNDGRDWERPVSVELINPDGSKGFQIDAGLRIRGGWSRHPDNPKHAFRLFFRSDYGESQLTYPLFGTAGADEFDKIDLRCSANNSWCWYGDPRDAVVRNAFSDDTQLAMGEPATRTQPYQLYINGQYWGLYETEERAEADYAADYFGGKSEDYDAIKVEPNRAPGFGIVTGSYNITAVDGTLDAWHDLWTLANAGFVSDAAYYRVLGKNPDGTRNPSYPVYVDENNLIDYMTTIFYTGNIDAPVTIVNDYTICNNFFAIYNRNGQEGFKFFCHDSEDTLQLANDIVGGDVNRTLNVSAGDIFGTFNPQWLHQQLMANAEYRIHFADRVQKFFFNGGVLSTTAAQARYQARADQTQFGHYRGIGALGRCETRAAFHEE